VHVLRKKLNVAVHRTLERNGKQKRRRKKEKRKNKKLRLVSDQTIIYPVQPTPFLERTSTQQQFYLRCYKDWVVEISHTDTTVRYHPLAENARR
jgi:hypothetical protein